MSGGGATWHENQLIPVTRHGKVEQVYWTYSYSPIDEDDGIAGVLVVCQDVTRDVVATAALRERGACLAAAGDTARARADLDRAIALDPRDPVNWNSRGFHRWALHGDHERALADYAQAIKLNPNYTYAINNRGSVSYTHLTLPTSDLV